MGRKPKFDIAVKIKACEDYEAGKGSFISIGENIGASKKAVSEWYYAFKIHDVNAFATSTKNRAYSKEFKDEVVYEYIAGNASSSELGAKYNISIRTINKWINKYYNGIENEDYIPKGEVYTMESRKTTFEQRLEIVNWVINNNMNYKEAASRYGIKYALVYQWVKKYVKGGAEALEYKKRGPKHKNSLDESVLSEVEKLRLELDRERQLRKRAEFSLEVLKKKEEFAKKLHFRK